MTLPGEVPPAVPAVVGERVGVAIERRQVGLVDGDAERQPGRRVDAAEQDVGESGPGLAAAVPGLHDRGHGVDPTRDTTTALPAWTATTVRGLAAATARMSATSSGQPQRRAVAADAEAAAAALGRGAAASSIGRRDGDLGVEALDDLGLVGPREERARGHGSASPMYSPSSR